MAVVPLVLEGPNANVVESQEAFASARGPNGDSILIQNLDREQLLDIQRTNISYDLRVGELYRDHRDQGSYELHADQELILRPGAAVIVQTEEIVHLPKTMFGHIVPKVSLLQKGLSNTSSKVDPGYPGPLLITVFNLGKRRVSLKRGDKFCCLYILEVSGLARPYGGDRKRILGTAKRHWLDYVFDYLESRTGAVHAALIFVTLLLLIEELFDHIFRR